MVYSLFITFYLLQLIARHLIRECLSIRPSVRLSVTLLSHIYTVQDIEVFFIPSMFVIC